MWSSELTHPTVPLDPFFAMLCLGLGAFFFLCLTAFPPPPPPDGGEFFFFLCFYLAAVHGGRWSWEIFQFFGDFLPVALFFFLGLDSQFPPSPCKMSLLLRACWFPLLPPFLTGLRSLTCRLFGLAGFTLLFDFFFFVRFLDSFSATLFSFYVGLDELGFFLL